MKEMFDAVFGLLIIPEPDDPLDRWDMLYVCWNFINLFSVVDVCSITAVVSYVPKFIITTDASFILDFGITFLSFFFCFLLQ